MKTCLHILAISVLIVRIAGAAPPAESRAAAKATFGVMFVAYDGDPTGKPEAMAFQINAMGLQPRTEFLKLGEKIHGSKLKLAKFAYKIRRNEKLDKDEDVSELTLVNVETGTSVVLVLNAKAADLSAVK